MCPGGILSNQYSFLLRFLHAYQVVRVELQFAILLIQRGISLICPTPLAWKPFQFSAVIPSLLAKEIQVNPFVYFICI